ncbi:MAG: efflux RND transporter periplasmic adaptor subunit [Phormidesmis sp.]
MFHKMFVGRQLALYTKGVIRAGLLLSLLLVGGCGLFAPSEAQQGRGAGGRREGGRGGAGERKDGPIAVKTARAQTGSLAGALTYTGTTRPTQQVALRSQISGEVVDLAVDVGDAVERGSVLAQLDGDLQASSVTQAQAELSSRQADTAQVQVSIADAQAAVVQAQATLDQARIDARRLRQLANQGALAQQQAEAAELAVTNGQQAVRSAQARVAAQRQAVASAVNQVEAQRAVVAQTQKQLSYADLRSPLSGVVLSRQAEAGDFVESGAVLLELGDLSTLEVTVQVSELDIVRLSVGQSAQVRLDAFPDDGAIAGQITRIAPIADATSRLIPVQLTIPNPDRRVGSGLLARVQFAPRQQARVVIPLSSLAVGDEDNGVFLVEGKGEQAKAVARSVRTGERNQDQVEILSGLEPDEVYVVQSDRPLTSGQAVRLSILSE